MTKKERNIGLFVLIAGAGVAYLVYESKQKEKEGKALLDLIAKGYSQVDISAGGDQAIAETKAMKIDPNKLRIGKLSGKYTPEIRNAMAKVMTELYASMKGAGTNVEPFYKALGQVKSKNTMAFLDKMYKAQFGQGLFEAMKEETALNNAQYGAFSDKTKGPLNNIPFINSYWNPTLSKFLQMLPQY